MSKPVRPTKYCPQHGYPLPCDKCGAGLAERIFSDIEAIMEPTVPATIDYRKYHAVKLKYVGDGNEGRDDH